METTNVQSFVLWLQRKFSAPIISNLTEPLILSAVSSNHNDDDAFSATRIAAHAPPAPINVILYEYLIRLQISLYSVTYTYVFI